MGCQHTLNIGNGPPTCPEELLSSRVSKSIREACPLDQ
jgi:hypothetical protein